MNPAIVSVLTTLIGSGVRHGLSFLGISAVVMATTTEEQVTGAIVTLVTFVWSVVKGLKSNPPKNNPLKTTPQK